MKRSIEAIIAANLRDKVKIIIGGERSDEEVCNFVGADAWTNDVIDGIKKIKKWAESNYKD